MRFATLPAVLTLVALTGLSAVTNAQPTPTSQPEIEWRPYGEDVFAQAKKQHKLIILDLHAVWCHWCHVQDKETYANAEVQKMVSGNFLAIGVDQDSRPDISNRYEDWGWPATIIFNSDGQEIVKRRGFIPPERMISLLQAVIKDPTPGPSVEPEKEIRSASRAALSPASEAVLKKAMGDFYDESQGAWGIGDGAQKFVDASLIEYSIIQAQRGDKVAEHRVRQTLTAALKIMDPAWGGVYQYSTNGDWVHPHFEKIMSYQTDDMKTYAKAYAIWKDPAFLAAAQGIHHFLDTFLRSDDGGYYTSMDADRIPGEHAGEFFALSDGDRRKLGIPKIDKHQYARENGWVVSSLVGLHEFAGDPQALNEAIATANWVIDHRSIDGSTGGFRHDAKDVAGPYLGDTLAMGRAFLDLYQATADIRWLEKANSAADYIEKSFVSTDPKSVGVLTSIVHPGDRMPPGQEMDENVNVVRFARLLYAYTGIAAHQELAERAMKYLASPDVAGVMRLGPALLIANEVMQKDPPHVVVDASRSNPQAAEFYSQIVNWPVAYKRIEWHDPAAPKMQLDRNDVEYPVMEKPAVFVCANGACSSPISDQSKLASKLDSLSARQ